MLGNEEKIQCKERNKLQLTFLELSKTGEKLYLKSRVHSFINGEGNGTPLQYSCLENPMDGGAWLAAVHRVAKSWTRLSDFTFTFHFHALQKEMATHSSVLAWRIPGTGEPGGLRSVGSHRVVHDWSNLAAAAAAAVSLRWELNEGKSTLQRGNVLCLFSAKWTGAIEQNVEDPDI